MSEHLERAAVTRDRIAQAMKDTGKKQVDLVRETGLNKSIISRCLSGKTEPKSGTIALLARALDVSAVKIVRMRYTTCFNERSRIKYQERVYQIIPETFNANHYENTLQFLMQLIVNDK